jgi:glycosyltransferase involved in cell wall biosynthesis
MPYLEKTIESIRCQESVEIELVVVLDRPTESLKVQTELILANFKKTQLLVSPGSGISDALNFGIEHCQSEYVARIDSDDEMIKDRLIKQKLFLDKNPVVSAVGTQVIRISESGSITGRSRYPNNASLLRKILRIRNCMAHPSVMYRRDEVLRLGGYRATFDGAEDYDLWVRLSRKGNLVNLNECLTKYRIWNGQDTNRYKSDKNLRAYRVQLFSELEEVAPEYATGLISKKSSKENLTEAAEDFLRAHAALRWRRLRSIFKLNEALNQRNQMLYISLITVVFSCILKISFLSLLIKFTENRH